MKRILAALVALLFLQPELAPAGPHMRRAVAACRAGSVRLQGGLCCPRSGVTRRGGCVSGVIRPGIVPPPARLVGAPTIARPEVVFPQLAPVPASPRPEPPVAIPAPHTPGAPLPGLR